MSVRLIPGGAERDHVCSRTIADRRDRLCHRGAALAEPRTNDGDNRAPALDADITELAKVCLRPRNPDADRRPPSARRTPLPTSPRHPRRHVRLRSNTSKIARSAPGVASMRGLRTFTITTFALPAIARTGSRGASKVMRVPFPPAGAELNTYTGMPPRRTAGAIVFGCSTLAPKLASSAASSNRMCSISFAPSTTRGSAVSMPSTSVQISIASASSAAPSSDAL